MDLLVFLISITLMGFSIQAEQTYIVLGVAAVSILAAKDFKSVLLILISLGVLFFTNSMGMKEYWIFAIFILLGLAYLLGMGKEEAPADPYAGLLGGMGGGMPGME